MQTYKDALSFKYTNDEFDRDGKRMYAKAQEWLAAGHLESISLTVSNACIEVGMKFMHPSHLNIFQEEIRSADEHVLLSSLQKPR